MSLKPLIPTGQDGSELRHRYTALGQPPSLLRAIQIGLTNSPCKRAKMILWRPSRKKLQIQLIRLDRTASTSGSNLFGVKQDRRIVFVTRFGNPEHWHYDPHVFSKGWLNSSMFEFLAKAMNSEEPLGHSLTYKSVLVSEDNHCRIYLDGTKPALEKHGAEILGFLTH
jgi:hypothetical protein